MTEPLKIALVPSNISVEHGEAIDPAGGVAQMILVQIEGRLQGGGDRRVEVTCFIAPEKAEHAAVLTLKELGVQELASTLPIFPTETDDTQGDPTT